MRSEGSTMAEQPRCQGTTKAGQPCRSFALPGGRFCFMHSGNVVAIEEARKKGGAKAAKLSELKGKRQKLTTLPALVRFTSDIIQDVKDGTLPPDTARVVLYGVSIQRQLVEPSDTEKRLASLESLAAAIAAAQTNDR